MEWQNIKDTQPEVGERVLVYWINNSQHAEHVTIERWNGLYFETLDPRKRHWIQVTHWMPLPKAPDR